MTVASIDRLTIADGKVRFKARVRVAGYPAQYATFSKLLDAKAWSSRIEADMRAGRYQSDALARLYTAGDLIDRYLDCVLPVKSKKARFVEQQRRQLLWWRKEIGEYLLINVTPFLLTEKRELLARDRAAGTVNRYLHALGHAFNTARKEWGWIEHSPLEKVRHPKEPRGRVRFLSDDELQRLLVACRKVRHQPLYEIVFLALATGARKGELLGLRWRDVDLQRGRAVVHETKNSERRSLYMGADALAVLRQMHARKRGRSDLVFAPRRGNQPINIERSWSRARRAAKLDDFRFHDLRHTAASYLAMNGASLADIAEALGHKTLGMVKRYAHLADSHTADVVSAMNDKLFHTHKQGDSDDTA